MQNGRGQEQVIPVIRRVSKGLRDGGADRHGHGNAHACAGGSGDIDVDTDLDGGDDPIQSVIPLGNQFQVNTFTGSITMATSLWLWASRRLPNRISVEPR